MTFKALFSKQERDRLRKEKAEAKATAELETRKSALRNAPEVLSFISWYENQVKGKRDKDINFVQLGYEAHDRYWHLVEKYPDVATLSGHKISITATNRYYSWLDDEASWHDWTKDKMEEHYQDFIAQENKLHLYGDYSLQAIGPLGGGKDFAYAACAYLSYAYYEKRRWQDTIKSLKKLIEE
ncbi:MAG: hypothetical protein HFJ41_06445 [Clostridia bacterium]|jgi:hypothetical protein|nr:hypothetical protein [Clostridia bacterium]